MRRSSMRTPPNPGLRRRSYCGLPSGRDTDEPTMKKHIDNVPRRAERTTKCKENMNTKITTPSLLLALAHLISHFSPDASASEKTPLNGASPRPFYVIGHNTDKLWEVEDALAAGANALGPDIGSSDDCQPDMNEPLRVMHGD